MTGRIRLTILCLALWSALQAGLCAESGSVTVFPSVLPRGGSGLQLRMDSRWVNGSGFRPVRVTVIDPTGPSATTRTMRIELRPEGPAGRDVTQVIQSIELPEGQASSEATILVPQSDLWSAVDVSVFEDGYRLEELSGTMLRTGANPRELTEAQPAILVIDRNAPTFDEQQQLIAGLSQRGAAQLDAALASVATLLNTEEFQGEVATVPLSAQLAMISRAPRGAFLPPQEIPTNWLGLTSVDLIYLSWDSLQAMRQEHPDRWEAVATWLHAGGNLIVFDERMHAQLADVSAALAGQPQWRLPPVGIEVNRINTPRNTSRVTGAGDPAQALFRLASVGLGTVVAANMADPGGAPAAQRQWLLNALGFNNWMWHRRLGISMIRQNPGVHDYSIPGVGEPPLVAFMLSITLFVIILGPVNYLLLRRLRRLYLMLLTVPLGAALVTGGLMFYAVLIDGLGIRVMVHSYTQLDQGSGRSTSWARHTYFAGLRPSGGLTFEPTTAVFPLWEDPQSDRWELRDRPRELRWVEAPRELGESLTVGGQALRKGYLASRTNQHLLVVKHRRTTAQLEVQEGASCSVANRLGARIVALWVCDSKGQAWQGANLAEGAEIELAKLDATQVNVQFRERLLSADQDLATFVPRIQTRSRRRFGRIQSPPDGNLPLPVFREGLGQRLLREHATRPLARRSYLAILARDPFTDVGASGARWESASFNVVHGEW